MNVAPPRIVANALPPVAEELLRGCVELVPWEAVWAGDPTATGMFIYGHPPVTGEMLDRLPRLRVISNHGVGVDHIDVAAAAVRGVPVGNTPGVLDGAVADMAFALLLAAARRLAEGDRYARSPGFLQFDPSYMLGREAHGSTLGIVGLGNIGAEIARRARAFNMRLLYCNRRRRDALEAELGARHCTLDELLRQADYVLIVVPLSETTRALIGRRELGLMKPTATLVNVSRGAVVDTEALTEALVEKRIYAAALDVTEPEPLPRDHPLLRLDNVTIVPHLGSATEETRAAMSRMAVENLFRGLAGGPLLHQVAVG